MDWRPIVIILATGLSIGSGWAQPKTVQPGHRHGEHRFPGYRRNFDLPPLLGPHRLPQLLIEPPGSFPQMRDRGFSPLERDQIQSAPSYAHGFNLTVPVSDDKSTSPLASLNRYVEVGQALGLCWRPPAGLPWKAITLRLSFKRDGSVNGQPRIPFTDAGSADRNTDLAHSLMAALKQCAPLPFSPSLGSAIAGEIFAIRFTHQDRQ